MFPRGFRPHTGPGRAHMGPYGPIWAQESQKIRQDIAFMGPFKGPITLP